MFLFANNAEEHTRKRIIKGNRAKRWSSFLLSSCSFSIRWITLPDLNDKSSKAGQARKSWFSPRWNRDPFDRAKRDRIERVSKDARRKNYWFIRDNVLKTWENKLPGIIPWMLFLDENKYRYISHNCATSLARLTAIWFANTSFSMFLIFFFRSIVYKPLEYNMLDKKFIEK